MPGQAISPRVGRSAVTGAQVGALAAQPARVDAAAGEPARRSAAQGRIGRPHRLLRLTGVVGEDQGCRRAGCGKALLCLSRRRPLGLVEPALDGPGEAEPPGPPVGSLVLAQRHRRLRHGSGGLQQQAGEEELEAEQVRTAAEDVQGDLLAGAAPTQPSYGLAPQRGGDHGAEHRLLRRVGRGDVDDEVPDAGPGRFVAVDECAVDAVVGHQPGRLGGEGLRLARRRGRVLCLGEQLADAGQSCVGVVVVRCHGVLPSWIPATVAPRSDNLASPAGVVHSQLGGPR